MACGEHQNGAPIRKSHPVAGGRPTNLSLPPGLDSKVDEARNSNKILPLAEVEKQAILNALERFNGNKLVTARVLGIGKTTLYRKLKEYGIFVS
jgi:transcriptional regulator of acetoin/glycerol metabolism